MLDNRTNSYLWIAGAGLSVTAVFVLREIWKRYSYWNAPFVKAGTVKQLYVHPIKSGKVKEVPWLECSVIGASYGDVKDRHFLMVDAKLDNQFLTARQYPRMVLIDANVEGYILTVCVPNGGSVTVNLEEVVKKNEVRRATLHMKLKTDGYDCGHEVGDLIGDFLGVRGKRDIRLLYFTDNLYTERNLPSEPNYWNNPVPKIHDTAAYQDLAAYLLCTQGSVDELNQWLIAENPPTVIEARNFRPNILVDGTVPWDEDRWLEVKIGEVEFTCYKPCTRCIFTTVHPDEGEFDSNTQPLKKLREKRLAPEGKLRDLFGNSPIFGVNMALKKSGKIRIGDEVLVRYKPTPY